MSENAISLKSASVHHLESAIRHPMKRVDAGFKATTVVLGPRDTAWNPLGGRFRGPAVVQFVMSEKTGQIHAFSDDDTQF